MFDQTRMLALAYRAGLAGAHSPLGPVLSTAARAMDPVTGFDKALNQGNNSQVGNNQLERALCSAA